MSLRRVFQRGPSSKSIKRSSRRRSTSTRLRLVVDRLEEYTAPNMLVPGSLAIGIGLAAAATTAVASAVADPAGDRGPNDTGAMHPAPVRGPFAATGLEIRGKGHHAATSGTRPATGAVHGTRTADSSHPKDASLPKAGAPDEPLRFKMKAPLNPNTGSAPVASRGSQSHVSVTTPSSPGSRAVAPSGGGTNPAAMFAGAVGYLPSSPIVASAGMGLPPTTSRNGGAGATGTAGVSLAGTGSPTASPSPTAALPAPQANGFTAMGPDGIGLLPTDGRSAPPVGGGGVGALCSGCSGGGLLNIAQDSVGPDIASGARTSMSYTQIGNNANPLKYIAVPLQITLGNGFTSQINNPSSGGPATTSLNVSLNNTGNYSQFMAGDGLSVTGSTAIDGSTFDGTLVTAQVQAFSFSKPTVADTEFAVQLIVTGGLLAQQPTGQLQVGGELSLLIHQPGLTVGTFPQTFSYDSYTGSSDLEDLAAQIDPPPPPQPQPNNPLPVVIIVEPPVDPPQNGIAISDGGSNVPYPTVDTYGSPDATGAGVALYNGSLQFSETDLTIPGRGFDWSFERTYRSDVSETGPLGHNWDFNYDRHLVEVTTQDLPAIQVALPSAKVGDVVRQDGLDRTDLYVQNPDGSYTAPAGYFTQLVRNADGSFAERDSTGMVVQYGVPAADGTAPMTSMTDRNGNTMQFQYNGLGQLVRVLDTLGRPINYIYDTDPNSASDGLLIAVQDFTGRTISFHYDAAGDLVGVTSPAVTGTPTGNDFPQGKTEAYTYSSGFSDEALDHDLLTITSPDEVADGGPPRIALTYGTNPQLPSYDRVISQMQGGTNASGVPSGGVLTYQYQFLATAAPGDTATPVFQTITTDRDGNLTTDQFNQLGNIVDSQVFNNRDLRPSDPASYTTSYQYNKDELLLGETFPQGNSVSYVYDSSNPDRLLQGNLLAQIETADPARGGDQLTIETTYTYEPIDDQVHSMTEARGNDPGYVPPNGGANSPARYTTVYTYDYQEGSDFAGLGSVLGMSAAQVQQLLALAGIPMGLGDVNGDGQTDGLAGNLIRVDQPTVRLLAGSNEVGVEGSTSQPIVTLYTYNRYGQRTSQTDPEGNVTEDTYYPADSPDGSGVIEVPGADPTTGGYLASVAIDTTGAPGRDSGTNPVPADIQDLYLYNPVGDVIRSVDGRGIATDYVVNQLNQVVETVEAAAHGVDTPAVAEPLPLADFQYLERLYYDANNDIVLSEIEDRGNTSKVQGNPPAADLPILGVDLASASTGRNGARTLDDTTQQWATNQWVGEAVRITSGPGVGEFALIVSNTADQLTLSTPWAAVPGAGSRYAIYPLITPDPIGGATAFQDTVTKYDILDQPIETVEEVSNGTDSQFLDTLTRYDPNGNVVLTIEPEGNATAMVYDERNLVYQAIQGATSAATVGPAGGRRSSQLRRPRRTARDDHR